jgi:hypothetical protein
MIGARLRVSLPLRDSAFPFLVPDFFLDAIYYCFG